MLSEELQDKIEKIATDVNSESEKYQLIHACSAIENLMNEKYQKTYEAEIEELKEKIKICSVGSDDFKELINKVNDIKRESRKKHVTISVNYLSSLIGKNARTTRIGTYFMISLPKEMEKIRNDDGTIDYDKMKEVRALMAHELGHVILHADLISEQGVGTMNQTKEEEAEVFAATVLKLRRDRNRQIFEDKGYEKF
ncbi:MAG: ImmA/IrrE family metallo-endopeptidase [Blautia sp.]|nr:ImmA/IrrE family metallo-endopeptidase [Blautia sp.]